MGHPTCLVEGPTPLSALWCTAVLSPRCHASRARGHEGWAALRALLSRVECWACAQCRPEGDPSPGWDPLSPSCAWPCLGFHGPTCGKGPLCGDSGVRSSRFAGGLCQPRGRSLAAVSWVLQTPVVKGQTCFSWGHPTKLPHGGCVTHRTQSRRGQSLKSGCPQGLVGLVASLPLETPRQARPVPGPGGAGTPRRVPPAPAFVFT